MNKVLTIAGSDSGGGAGIQADLKTMTAHKVYGASVITAVTSQNTEGVQDVEVLAGEVVEKQLSSVLGDISFGAVKTGMLAKKEIVKITAQKIKDYGINNLVVDPVMVATSGDLLLEKNAVLAYKKSLIPLAKVITPNLSEAKVLTGRRDENKVSLKVLAKELHELGSEYVLVKGGHENSGKKFAIDILYDGREYTQYKAKRINTKDTHGTGCTFSSAIASCLARGKSMKKAVSESKKYITSAIETGFTVGKGNNPVNHLVNFKK